MPAHTHDGIDWVTRLADLRRADAANAPALRAVADRLVESLPAPQPIVFDVGCGAGGMSAALAEAMAGRSARMGTLPGTPPRRTTSPDNITGADMSDVTLAGSGHPTTADPRNIDPRDAGPRDVEPPDVERRHAERRHAERRVDRGEAIAGTLILVDAVPELLAAASEAARAAVGVAGMVDVRAARLDLADIIPPTSATPPAPDGPMDTKAAAADDSPAHRDSPVEQATTGNASADVSGSGHGFALPAADLIWASNVAHHLPDQRQAVAALAGWLAPGGCLALCEGGLSMRCLPWDLGVGEPGLQDRLIAAHGTWFHRMRTEMPGAVRLPVGWNQVLAGAGLSGVTAFSFLVDVPAPLTDVGRAAVINWLAWMTRAASDLLDPADVATLNRLLDEHDPAHVGRRDDVFLLKASTVYLGWRR